MTFNRKVDKLKKNLIFQLSISSLELFHSNFLYWLFSNYPDYTKILLSKWLDKNSSEIELTSGGIYREKENSKDMSFHIKENGSPKTIFLENKVKSLPDEEQLKKYSVGKENAEGILLCVIKPTFMEKETMYDKVKWNVIHYSDLAKELTTFSAQFEEGSYHHNVLTEYVELISFLCELPFEINQETDKYDWYLDEIFPTVKSLRLYDLYVKGKMSVLSDIVYKYLSESFPEDRFIRSKEWSKGKPGEIYLSVGFSNSASLLDVKCIIREGECVGGQLQLKDFRLFVETLDMETTRSLSQSYLTSNEWFRLYKEPCTHPKDPKHFNTFKNKGKANFLYRSIKLDKPAIDEILNYFAQTIAQYKDLMKNERFF